MQPKKFALIGGIIMLAFGVISLVPAFVGPTVGLPVLSLETSYGLFLNFFPMNVVNKIVLIVLGLIGIWCSQAPKMGQTLSIQYARVVFVLTLAGLILGVIPDTQTLFGYWPLFGGEILFNAIYTVVAAYYGYYLTSLEPEEEVKKLGHVPPPRTSTPAHGTL